MFIGLPVVDGLEKHFGINDVTHRFEFYASPWVLLLAPVLCIVVGVAVTCRDLQPKLEDFWQSRPIGDTRLFLVKYLVSLTVILLGCVVPLLIEIGSNQKNSIGPPVLWMTLVWLAAFSIAFAVGCIVRRTAHAAALSVVGLLLLFFLPVVFPPLSRFAISQLDDWISTPRTGGVVVYWPQVRFTACMCMLAAVLGITGLLSVRFHWRIETSKPLIYGAVSAAFVILIASASYQLGTNLPVLSRVDLLPGETVDVIDKSSAGWDAYSNVWEHHSDGSTSSRASYLRHVEEADGKMTLSPPQAGNSYFQISRHHGGLVYSTRSNRVGYSIDQIGETNGTAAVIAINSDTPGDIPNTIELWRHHGMFGSPAYLYAWNDRLYVVGQRSMVFDISNPAKPKRLIDDPTPFTLHQWTGVFEAVYTLPLPFTPGLPAVDKLRFLVRIYDGYRMFDAFDGSIWCRAIGRGDPLTLTMYRLRELTNEAVTFDLVATYKPTLVQSILGNFFINGMTIHDGLLYVNDYEHYCQRVQPHRIAADAADRALRLQWRGPHGRAVARWARPRRWQQHLAARPAAATLTRVNPCDRRSSRQDKTRRRIPCRRCRPPRALASRPLRR